jgi:hypothetical protein
MNDLSANDILLFGALAGVLVVIVLGLCWAVAHRGRQRWRAERADRVVAEGIQYIAAGPGDTVVVTYAGALTQEQRGQIIEAIERRLPKGVNALLMDGGVRVSHVVSVKDAPAPPPGRRASH